jgi:hypothetical protein
MIIDGKYVMTQDEKDAQVGRIIREERETRHGLVYVKYDIYKASEAFRALATSLQRFSDEGEYPSETVMEKIVAAEQFLNIAF